MSGYDDRMRTQQMADMYEVERQDPDPGPLWPRLKQGAEWYGIVSMVRAFFHF